MVITRTYNEPNARPEQITLEKAIKDLEGGGYYKAGCIKETLTNTVHAIDLRTPWAFYNFDLTKNS